MAFAIKRPKKRAAMDVTEETERLTKIVDYTNEHYKENITIAEICRYIKFWKAMALKIINYFGECFMTGMMVKRRSWLMKEGHALFSPKMLYEIDKAKDCITLVMPTKGFDLQSVMLANDSNFDRNPLRKNNFLLKCVCFSLHSLQTRKKRGII